MPSKFIVRDFAPDSYYHIYNQGFGDNKIFADDKDFNFFRTYLFIYTRPLTEVLAVHPDLPSRLRHKNLSEEISLVGYSLMPNYFHLLIKQTTAEGVSKLMKQVANAYTLYFNQKYHKYGPVFAGRFKAVKVPPDLGLITSLLKYIHNKPTNFNSFNDYLNQQTPLPCSPIEKTKILGRFANLSKFNDFHRNQIDAIRMADKIKPYLIEVKRSNP